MPRPLGDLSGRHTRADIRTRPSFRTSPPPKDLNHYWREAMPRYCRRYEINVRQRRVDLAGCTATEEHPDGSENSATDSLVWDIDGGTPSCR